MNVLLATLTSLSILANAVIYGTDVFGAIVQRPAMAAVDDRTLVQAMGNIHRVADRRFPVIGAIGLLTSAAMTSLAAVDTDWTRVAAGAVATVALLAFLAVYGRISQPINAQLTSAAVDDRMPDDARALQERWDSVIYGRVALQGLALAALCVALAAT